MPRYIMKIHDEKLERDWYLEWSTVVDAPVTYGMTLEDFTKYYQNKYGQSSMNEFRARMERVEKWGSSCFFDVGEGIGSYFECNRAGDNETVLSKEGILDEYCRVQLTQ